MSTDEPSEPNELSDFIRDIVSEDLASGKHDHIVTRFPPEPNGYLHIGHGKAICLNFGVAEENEGVCHLRFDDTNPAAEKEEFAEAMRRDIAWLGFDWGDKLFYTSDYFERLHGYAVELIEKGKAYVCDWSSEEIAANRGTLVEAATASPGRTRPVEENRDLFARMTAGEFEEGSRSLRAKIDLGSSVLTMRDPVIYRIQKAQHYRRGSEWCVYPMYDLAHALSDSIEHITHSLCSLEFADHRPLYDWFIENVDTESTPRQIEFARLNLSHTVMSKRILRELVEGGHVRGWDDPRMPTLSGLRRRGYTPESVVSFCRGVGIAKRENLIELARLEFSIRDDLNRRAPRRMAVLRPLKVVIENYPEGEVEELDAVNNPEDAAAGSRKVPFSREIYIERDDFLEDPPRKFFRLAPGREVRLRYAYFITCNEVVKDESGEIVELRCSYDPATRGGDSPDGRKVKGTLHWVSAAQALNAEVRLYETLFSKEDPHDLEEGQHFLENLNPHSLEVLEGCKLEPALGELEPGESCQFERLGYFCTDADSEPGGMVFNRTVTLRDTWAKVAQKGGAQKGGAKKSGGKKGGAKKGG
ncbi:MAG: glutamine--tRNA ligase/YqeY domain fusion protein [Deltaproteobacteria bacterium]|nr:glutamine--tRNA ligase/YqeY domain fusion protein [Deltaproteobacteria bacterium]